jgi:outer membrane murein-binding lipoprotein Lpp
LYDQEIISTMGWILGYNSHEVAIDVVPRDKKLEVLHNFSLMVIRHPLISYLMGFLTGQVDRVHFVADLKGAEVAVKLTMRRKALWPNEPFQATVSGVSMPNPVAFVQAVSDKQSDICVMLDFDNAEDTPWYQEVLLPDVSYVKDTLEAAQEESSRLKREMDRVLDIYRECKAMLNAATPEKKKEMEFYIGVAEQQLKQLSSQLDELNAKMKQLSDQA